MGIEIIGRDAVAFGPVKVFVDFANKIINLNGVEFTFDFLEQMHGAQFSTYSFRRGELRLQIHTVVPKKTVDNAHPEDRCECCGGRNMAWHAPSPIWNQVMRDASGKEKWGGIVCPACFADIAQREGIDVPSWCLTIHEEDRKQLKACNSGLSMRIFDWIKCLWQEEGTT